mmetsp:Transcript_28582/g.88626  ORF Transcript_28582/g.88626 Transcript_28582/m.88626 type:complete len:120 (-) Transcript_28582:732-1091(-)
MESGSIDFLSGPATRIPIQRMELLPGQHGMKRRFYTPNEIAAHNSADDAWFVIHHKVFELTDLIASSRGTLTQALIANAGRDISHWFDYDQASLKSHYDVERKTFCPYIPMGRFLHVPL